jgi:hypothetical protein
MLLLYVLLVRRCIHLTYSLSRDIAHVLVDSHLSSQKAIRTISLVFLYSSSLFGNTG